MYTDSVFFGRDWHTVSQQNHFGFFEIPPLTAELGFLPFALLALPLALEADFDGGVAFAFDLAAESLGGVAFVKKESTRT